MARLVCSNKDKYDILEYQDTQQERINRCLAFSSIRFPINLGYKEVASSYANFR